MSLPETYTNSFEGYTTTFYVWHHKRECVIRWDNISPIEVVIPYTTDLSPGLLAQALDKLMERAEDIPYEEYPFRSSIEISTETFSTYEIYWGPVKKYGVDYDDDVDDYTLNPKVRVFSSGHADSSVHRTVAIDTMRDLAPVVEDNLINLRRTLRY